MVYIVMPFRLVRKTEANMGLRRRQVDHLRCKSVKKTKNWSWMGVSKNMGTPKWMIYNGNPIKIDDLGVPLFLETSEWLHISFLIYTKPFSNFHQNQISCTCQPLMLPHHRVDSKVTINQANMKPLLQVAKVVCLSLWHAWQYLHI